MGTERTMEDFFMKKGCLITVASGVVVFFILIVIGICSDSNEQDENANNGISATTQESTSELKSNWEYSESKDPMTDVVKKFASIESENYVNFEFPYNGGSYMTITVREIGNEKDVYIRISKGQFIGNSFNGTNTIDVRFDDEKAIIFHTLEPQDLSTDLLFVQETTKFIAKAKTAKEIKISAQFYQEGSRAFTFKTNIPLECN